MKDQAGRLLVLAAMVRDAELARLRQAQDARRKVEQEMQGIASQQAEMIAGAAPDAAHLAGADDRWLIWADGRRQTLSVQSAQLAAAAEVQTIRARHAVGRADVLAKLSGKG